MILKTRSNFSIMRIDQSILIKKINGQHQAVLSDEDYKTFIDILAEYRNPKMLSLVNQSSSSDKTAWCCPFIFFMRID